MELYVVLQLLQDLECGGPRLALLLCLQGPPLVFLEEVQACRHVGRVRPVSSGARVRPRCLPELLLPSALRALHVLWNGF